jgi:hypothetical protein
MLKSAIRIALVLVLAAAATMAVLHYSGDDIKSRAKNRLTIHFTCDAAGRLQPCGCFTGQHGGLTRLRTWLDGRKHPGPVLKLDAGGAIAGTADYDIIQYRYMTRAYATMGFSALNMGGREAAIPAAELAKLAASSPVPLVSASLVDAESRRGLLEPYRIVKVGGIRVGVLGVVSPNSILRPGEGLAVLGLNEAVDRHLPELAAKSDIIILLAFADETEMRRLAKDYYEFALILGGDVAGSAQEILRENESMILFTTNQARTVGTLSARIGGGKRKHLVDPSFEIELLWDVIPQDAGLLDLVSEYRNEIRNTPLAIDDPDAVDPNAIPGVAMNATYVGSAICKSCHVEDHEIWEKSGHAHAFETLVKAGSDADPHCVSCHSIGFGKDSGYRRPMGSRSLVDVGCESCHGPASEHIARYVNHKPNGFKFRPLGPGDCKSCHYGEFSRPFDWDTFWPGIAHGAKAREAE